MKFKILRKEQLLPIGITALLFIILSCSTDAANQKDTLDRSANLLAAGESAKDLLTNSDFDKLVLQIAFAEGYAPSELAVEDLLEFISLRTFKSNVEVEYLPLAPSGKETFSLQEIADLEREHRTVYNNGKTLAIYLFFADAASDTDDPANNTYTLGAVYRNTSMVLYASTIQILASKVPAITNADLEAATLLHEFGHLLGLVNMGATEVNSHADPESENHCGEANCLMKASLQFTTGLAKTMQQRVAKNLSAVPELGPECLRDLKAAGGR